MCTLRLTTEQQALVSNNHKLIFSFLNKHHLDEEEFYDVVATGLCKAAIDYNPSSGFCFSTLAYKYMYNDLLRELKYRKRHWPTIASLDETTEDTELYYFVEDPKNDLSSCLCKIDMASKLNRLSYRELYLLQTLLVGGEQKDAAKVLGLTSSGVSALCGRMRDKFRGKGLYKNDVVDTKERRCLLRFVSELIYMY